MGDSEQRPVDAGPFGRDLPFWVWAVGIMLIPILAGLACPLASMLVR